jgi:thiol-disulfide isomerase/thioredoxin
LHHPILRSTLLALALCMLPASLTAQQPIPVETLAKPQGQPRPSGPPWLGLVANARPQGQGLVISRVLRGSPAQQAGLLVGDILMQLDAQPLSSARDFKIAMRNARPGEALKLSFIRDGHAKTSAITPGVTPTQQELVMTQVMGEQAPDIKLILLKDGKQEPISLHSLRGKPIVLEFWATWCGPCRTLIPTMNSLHARYGSDVHFIAISGETPELILKDVSATGKTYPVAQDPGERGHDDLFVKSYPLIYILDSDLKVRKVMSGLSGSQSIEEAIKAVSKR